MKILVGVPVFRVIELTRQSINSLLGTPADVLVIDNAADDDIKRMLQEEFYGKVAVIHNSQNGFCNGGWNQIMHHGITNGYDVIGLGSSDAVLHKGWYQLVVDRLHTDPFNILLPTETTEVCHHPSAQHAEIVHGGVAGFFQFLPRLAVQQVYPIPEGLKHWFGDQYMFERLRQNGWNIVRMHDMRAFHQQSAITSATPEAYERIERDKEEWKRLGGSV